MNVYIAVTHSTPDICSDLLRINESGLIEQYDLENKTWREADNGMSGIYTGDVECETITKEEANTIIERWLKFAD